MTNKDNLFTDGKPPKSPAEIRRFLDAIAEANVPVPRGPGFSQPQLISHQAHRERTWHTVPIVANRQVLSSRTLLQRTSTVIGTMAGASISLNFAMGVLAIFGLSIPSFVLAFAILIFGTTLGIAIARISVAFRRPDVFGPRINSCFSHTPLLIDSP